MNVLHERRGSQTLIALLHGHANHGARPRYVALAEAFGRNRYDTVRYIPGYEVREGARVVRTLSQEQCDARDVLLPFQERYRNIVLLGYSTGVVSALGNAELGTHLALVCPIINLQRMQRLKLIELGVTRDSPALRSGVTLRRTEDDPFVYTNAFFDDYEQHDVPSLLARCTRPALFMAGSKDSCAAPPAEVAAAQTNYRGPSSFVVLPIKHRFRPEHAPPVAEWIHHWFRETK